MTLVPPIPKVEIGHRQPGKLWPMLRKQHESCWITVWKWAKQDRIDNAEHGAICANAQSQRKDGNSCKSRIVFQSPKRVQKILCKGSHRRPPDSGHANS